ncbi:hypothetical protein [Kibdelosporangium aridum]|nr:hypothetical protein [Kibdelosporangium aridum]
MDKTLRAVTGILGTDYESRAVGGGGTNGKWVFTSLDQLDTLIKKWTGVRDAIRRRRDEILDARSLVYPPASDVMSRLQAEALKSSLDAMEKHADSMFRYADAYVKKLEETRTAYTATESGNTGRMNNTC